MHAAMPEDVLTPPAHLVMPSWALPTVVYQTWPRIYPGPGLGKTLLSSHKATPEQVLCL